MDRHINIISFNVPYPPNYGGIIDVYYKLKALREAGIRIILHCFVYERPPAPELEELCEKVYYYKRRTGLIRNFTLLPYNVYSRKDSELIRNLLENDYPILFEALHTCYYINDPRLKDRFKIYRESNIEHDYYRHLAKASHGFIKKCFLYVEAWRYKRYQNILRYADLMLVVSSADTAYLKEHFPDKRIEYMPSYHANDHITIQPGKSDFILYHGKLSVVENEQAALFLIKHVFSKLKQTCIVAGMDPSQKIKDAAAAYPNVQIEANPDMARMEYLITNAQIQLLITFQDTGLKLKLLNSLFAGRHTVVNSLMLTGSGLDDCCVIADTPDDMVRVCDELMELPMTQQFIDVRKTLLESLYSNKYQADRLLQLVYETDSDKA